MRRLGRATDLAHATQRQPPPGWATTDEAASRCAASRAVCAGSDRLSANSVIAKGIANKFLIDFTRVADSHVALTRGAAGAFSSSLDALLRALHVGENPASTRYTGILLRHVHVRTADVGTRASLCALAPLGLALGLARCHTH